MAVDIQQFLNVMAKRPQRGVIYSGQMERDEHERQMPVMDDVNVDLQAPGVNVDENVAVTPPNIVRKPSITSEAEWNDDPPEFDRWGNKIKYGNDLPSDGGITGRQRPPLDDAYDQARGAYINAVNAPIEKQPLWKDIIVGGLQGLSNFANRESKPVKLWGAMKHDKAVEDAGRALAPLTQLKKIASDEMDAVQNREWKKTQIANTNADNVARDAKDKATVAGQRRNSFFRRYKNFDASKATPAQVKELAEFGETPESVGSFDFTKPNVQTIAGQKFLFNANTRSFEDAGLPKDGSKAIVDYTVIDPTTGVESKYSTTSERAAGLKTQLAAAGLQIQAAERRQASTQQFQAGENEKTRAHQVLMASHTAKLRDLSSQREALLRDANNAASQKRASEIQQEMIRLRQEMKDSESGLPVVGAPIQQ